MTQDEAVKEAAKHTGFYQLMANRAIRAGQIFESDLDDAVQNMYIAACRSLVTFDKTKGSISNYLTLPCRGVLRNMGRAKRRGGTHLSIEFNMSSAELGGGKVKGFKSGRTGQRHCSDDELDSRGHILPGVEHDWPDLDADVPPQELALADAKEVPVLSMALNGMTNNQVAAELGVSASNAHQKRSRAIKVLRRKYAEAMAA